MEDTMGALDRWPNGSRVDEVHLEQPETRVGAAHGLQVLRLALIFCSENPPVCQAQPATEFEATRRAEQEEVWELSQHRSTCVTYGGS